MIKHQPWNIVQSCIDDIAWLIFFRPDLIPIRAVPTLTVCCGEGRDIRVAGLFLSHFRTLSQSHVKYPPDAELAQCWKRLGEHLNEHLSSSLLPRHSDQARPALQTYGKIISPIISHCITSQSSCWLSPESPGGENTEPSESFFPKGCQQSHTGFFLI